MGTFLFRHFIKNYEDVKDPQVRDGYGKLAGVVGIISNVVLCLMKVAVGLIAGSIAIVADGINNLADSASSVITLVGFKLAAMPEDEEHPYGHARYEYLSSLAVSVIIILVGFELGKSSLDKILHPTPLDFSWTIVLVLVIAIAIKVWQALFNVSAGKRIDSMALIATGADSRNDVISTGRKADLLDIAMAQQVIDYQLLYTICRTIVNLDELPGHTECDLVHANPYLLHLFLNNSTTLQPEPDGHYNTFSIMMAASALSCEDMIPSPYSHDHVHHKGCDIARQILPLELIKLALTGKQDTPTRFGSVGFSPDDVVAISANQGKALTVEEATIWWEKYESEFKKRMRELGLNLLSEIISQQDTEVKPC